METPSPSGEQPTAEPTPTPEAGAQPQNGEPQAAVTNILDTDPAVVLAFLNGSPPPLEVAVAPDPAQASTEPITTEGEEPPVVEPQAEPEPVKHAARIRLTGLSDADQKLAVEARALVADGKASSLFEAMKTLAGDQPPVQAAPVAQAEPEPAVTQEPAPTVEALETKLTDLETRWKTAKENFEPEEAELHLEILRTYREIGKAEQQAQVQKVEVQNYAQNFQTAVNELETKYEAVLDADPRFEKVLNALKVQAEAEGDARIGNPRYILDLAEEAAEMLGIQVGKPTATRNAQKVVTPAPAAPIRAAKPVGAVAPGHTQNAIPTPDQLKQSMQDIPVEDLARLLDRVGVR